MTTPASKADPSKTILDYFHEHATATPDRVFLTQPMGGDAAVKTFTFQQVVDEALKMSQYIASLNLEPGSRIAIMSKNTAWWLLADLAILQCGHVSVPVYPTLTAETTKYILEHAEAKLLFVGKLDQNPWMQMKEGIPSTLDVIAMPLAPDNVANSKPWADVIAKASSLPEFTPVNRTLDEMATIIYTSGSTGKPKGVMTSFKAMTLSTKGLCKMLKAGTTDRYLSYLPISHGMERWTGECAPFYAGYQVFYAESLSTFVADLNRCRPTLFLSVPRLWTKFQAGVFGKMPESKLNFYLSIPLISYLVKRKILKGLGLDCVRFAGSGSAPLPQSVLEWYRRLGLELLEGYGMTENFNYSHMSMPGKSRPGYVGNCWPDAVQRIDETTGEIQIKGPGNMMGYYKNDEATKEAITDDGYVRTGDKGTLDNQGRLKITGRTKEIFKTSKGKYVAPAPIENLLIAHHAIELACVGGRSHPQPHAILQLSEGPKKAASSSGPDAATTRANLTKELETLLKDTVNPSVDPHEHLQFVVIVKDEWLPENGFLTPTQKIKRNTIEDAYAKHLDEWYASKSKVIWFGF